jgi:hypothetical protein
VVAVTYWYAGAYVCPGVYEWGCRRIYNLSGFAAVISGMEVFLGSKRYLPLVQESI